LVEDEPEDASASIALLDAVGEDGADVTHVASAEDALIRIGQEGGPGVDAVLLDLGLPGLSGLDALRAVLSRAPEVPVIVLTANEDADLALLAIAAGAQDVLIKRATDATALARSIAFAGQRQARLKRNADQAPAAESVESSKGELRGLRVMLVDDSDESRALVAAYLATTGATLFVADDAHSGLEELAHGTYDVILMDLHLPGVDGFAATHALRQAESTRGAIPVPVVALSADAAAGTVKSALASGFSEYLSKPIRKAELVATLRRYLAHDAGVASPPQRPGMSRAARALLPKFLDHRERDIGSLREATARLDYGTIATLAHNMRGNGISYGFPEVSEIGLRLEDAARARDAASVEREIEKLEDCLRRIRAETGLLPSPSSSPRHSSATRVRAAPPAKQTSKTGPT
jgi:CheY-like chemotaxis protein